MTEEPREDALLSELLDGAQGATSSMSGAATAAHRYTTGPEHQPILTQRDERALLDAANRAGTPTLAPQASETASAATSFVGEITTLIRRYPIPVLLASVGIAYLLTRRRH